MLKLKYYDTIKQMKQSFTEEIESLNEMLSNSLNLNNRQRINSVILFYYLGDKIKKLTKEMDKMVKANKIIADANEKLKTVSQICCLLFDLVWVQNQLCPYVHRLITDHHRFQNENINFGRHCL